jgi:hypothetical protein
LAFRGRNQLRSQANMPNATSTTGGHAEDVEDNESI